MLEKGTFLSCIECTVRYRTNIAIDKD